MLRGSARRSGARRLCLVFVGCLLGTVSAPVSAQEAGAVGGIRGVAVDADSGSPVANARVFISSGHQVVSDGQGHFVADALPPGVYDLTVSKSGYAREVSRDVPVIAGSFREVRVNLQAEVYEMDELVVTGDLTGESEAALVLERQESSAVLDSLGSEMFSRTGASTAAGAVKKLVGTSLVDDKYVVVRGLADRYLSTLVNGAPIPSSDPDKRAVNVDIFPTAVLDSIRSTKTFTPDLPGESSGGSIDIRTKKFPDGFTFSLGASMSYLSGTSLQSDFLTYEQGGVPTYGFDRRRSLPDEAALLSDNVSSGDPAGSSAQADEWDRGTKAFTPVLGGTEGDAPLDGSYDFVLGDTVQLFGRPLGILMAGSYDRGFSLIDDGRAGRYLIQGSTLGPRPLFDVVPIPELYDYKKGTESLLMSGLFNLAFRPSDNHEVSLTMLYTQAADDRSVHKRTPVDSDSRWADIDAQNSEEFWYDEQNLVYTERSLNVLQLAGKHVFDELGGAVIEWTGSRGNSRQYEPDSRLFRSIQHKTEGYYTTTGQSPTSDPDIRRQWRDYRDESYHAQVDLSLPLFGRDVEEACIKTGVSHDYATRDFQQKLFTYVYGDQSFIINPDWSFRTITRYDPVGDESWAEVFPELDQNIGRVQPDDPGLFLNKTSGMYWYLVDRTAFAGTYEVEQLLTAGYVMADMKVSDSVRFVAGARAETTDLVAQSGGIVPGLTTSRGEIQQLDVLPSVSGTIEVAKDMNVRLAYGRTLARPSFKEFAPTRIEEFIEGESFLGNPNLVMSHIDNFDVRWEWFPRPGEVYGLGAFYKRIDDPIELARFDDGVTVQYRNFDLARVYGIEMEMRRRLDMLGGILGDWDWLKLVEISVNAAYLESQVERPPAQRGLGATRPLQGQPSYTANLGLTYDNPDGGTLLSLFMNMTGPYLYTVPGGTLVPEIYEYPPTSLDLTVKQDFGDHWSVTLRAKNLLDSESRRAIAYNGREYLYNYYTRGREFSLGLDYEW